MFVSVKTIDKVEREGHREREDRKRGEVVANIFNFRYEKYN